MPPSRTLLLTATLLIATSLALPAALASHNNKGTVKVHDEEDEDPDQRNVPHVECDFWIQGFKMGDDSGWIEFFSWPPTGDKSEVTPTGDDLDWTANSGNAEDGWGFLNGPYQLPEGHYRVEVFTDDGHPGRDGGHFAKAKMFWVDPCDEEGNGGNGHEHPPCPPGVTAEATTVDGQPAIELDWDAVADADDYVVYRAVAGGDFELLATTDATSYTDLDVEAGVTYEYYVTAVIDNVESENCEIVEATAIPFFGAPALVALGLLGSIVAYTAFRRR